MNTRPSLTELTNQSSDFKSDIVTIVIDNGSEVCKAGFAHEAAPSVILPTVVGYMSEGGGSYVGADAQSKRDHLKLSNPIKKGGVANWDDMERVWDYVLNQQLRAQLDEQTVLLTEPALNSTGNHEKTAELMFERLGASTIALANQSVLALYATDRISGFVLDCGGGVTDAVPVVDGYPVAEASMHVDVAGRDLTGYLTKILHEGGHHFKTAAEREAVRDMKEKLCYVPLDFAQEMTLGAALNTSFELPDGRIILVGSERLRCPQALFEPALISKEAAESGGIHKLAYDSIVKCDVDRRKDMFSNILVTGGSTMFPGFVERLHKELAELVPSGTEIKIIAPPDRKTLTWVGGSRLASISTFNEFRITKKAYDEGGSNVLREKCL